MSMLGSLPLIDGKIKLKSVKADDVYTAGDIEAENFSAKKVRSCRGNISISKGTVKESITSQTGNINLKEVLGYPLVKTNAGDVDAYKGLLGSVQIPNGEYRPVETHTGLPVVKGMSYLPDKNSTVTGEVNAQFIPFDHKWQQFKKAFAALFNK